MSVFADASAVVKLYAAEEGQEVVSALDAVAIAEINRVEVPAAFWRKHRIGELEAEHAQVLTAEFEADYYGTVDEEPRFIVIATTASILDQAVRLSAAYGLQAYDAVQLSTGMAARSADPACSAIATFDVALRKAAAAEGLDLLPAAVE